MSSKPGDPTSMAWGPFSQVGQAQTEAMLNLQKGLLDAYEQAGRSWLDRVKSEVDLWQGLAAKLAASRSVPEVLEAHQKWVS